MIFWAKGDTRMLRKICLIGACLVAAGPALAQSGSVTTDHAFARCGEIADPSARLACYDAAQPPRLPPNTPALGHSRYPEFNSASSGRTQPRPNAAANGSNPETTMRGKLVAGVATYSVSPSGRFTIVLDNGQVWQQIESDDGVAQFKARGRNMVAISKGFLWSYDLKLNSGSAVFKVRQVK